MKYEFQVSNRNKVKLYKILFVFLISAAIYSCSSEKKISLKKECTKNLYILCNDLLNIQNIDSSSENYGALFCSNKSCLDYHTRASESVLPFAVAYKESGNKKYLKAAIITADWLIDEQQKDGAWIETPSDWTGTTTDQLLMMASAFPIIKSELSKAQKIKWINSIKLAADWLVRNMNHEFASINYCATTTATLMSVFKLIPDSSYAKKAKKLSMLVASKFDEDFFLTGEGNRIRGTKYGIDIGYNMDMSLWGLGLYAKLANDEFINHYVKESLKRCIYFIYPDGSTDYSWGVRSSKWTTFGSFTADGCQILFSLYSKDNPVYREAALANMKYFMKMRVNGLLTYGPNYYDMYNEPPCIYPTMCRAKNLAMAILYGDQTEGYAEKIPTQKIGWIKYFKTIDVALVRTKNFMSTVTAYRYKDIRRGSDFKYMFRPSGGSITNLWVQNYGYLQASSQTEYHQWENNYPVQDVNSLSITPRIEFTDSNAYYTNLYEFDSHMVISENDNFYAVRSFGELKDKNRWEGGIAYSLTNIISDNSVEKKVKLRFHGQKHAVDIVEPFIQNKNTVFKKINDYSVEISGGSREFIFELLSKKFSLELGKDEEKYKQPFPSLKGYPITIKVIPDKNTFIEEIDYVIRIKNQS